MLRPPIAGHLPGRSQEPAGPRATKGERREQECVVSKLLHRVWPSVNVDAESFITAAVIGLSVLSLYGAFKLSELIF